MSSNRFFVLSLTAALLGAAPAIAQQHKATPVVPAAKGGQPTTVRGTVSKETLSGLDLIPNRTTGTFGVRINHRISKAATLRLVDTQTSRYVTTELLEASPAPTRAVQVGKLPNGEYKMELILPDTVYWKTVKVSRPARRG